MQYREFSKKIEQKEVSVGDRVWIVDFRRDQPEMKPLRNIPPTEVVLSKAARGEIYYFQPLGKSGNPLAKQIDVYPSHWRTNFSDSLHIFFTHEEAREKYLEQCEFMRRQVLKAQEEWYNKFNTTLDEIDMKVDTELKR